MKRLLGAGLTLALLAGTVVATQPANAAYHFDRLIVKSDTCDLGYDDPKMCGPVVHFQPGVIVTDPAGTVDVKFYDSKGKRLPVSHAVLHNEDTDYVYRLPTSANRGRITVKTYAHEPSKWKCSEYDPNGCSWVEGGTEHRVFQFTFNGKRSIIHPNMTGKVTLNKLQRIKRGKVLRLKGQGHYTPDTAFTSRRMTLRAEIRQRGKKKWRTLKTFKANYYTGRYQTKVKVPRKAGRYTVRVRTITTAGYEKAAHASRSVRVVR
ncbi:MAG: hypothetical protein WAS05_09185 [Candidatus Nanopelagicales bacterium]